MSNVEGPTSLVLTFGPYGPDQVVPSEAQGDGESIEYLRARERAEKAAAKSAMSIRARRVHQELAQYYSEQIHKRRQSG